MTEGGTSKSASCSEDQTVY